MLSFEEGYSAFPALGIISWESESLTNLLSNKVFMKRALLVISLLLAVLAFAGEYESPLASVAKWAKGPMTEKTASGPFIPYFKVGKYYAAGYNDPTNPALTFNTAALYENIGTSQFDKKKLEAWVRDHSVQNIEGLFASFAENEELKAYLDHRVYVFKSFSRQRGTTGPDDIKLGEKAKDTKLFRSIHYSPTGRFLFAFTSERIPGKNGSFEVKTGTDLEAFEIQPDYTLKPFLLDFTKPRGHPFVEAGTSCVRCHGSDKWTRPNSMGTYDLWSGMVAGHDDNMDPTPEDAQIPENRFVNHFLTDLRGKGTFKLSQWPDSPTFRTPTGMRANLMFHEYTHALNFLKIARTLTASPAWAVYKYSLVGAFLNCPDYPGFFPDDDGKRVWKKHEENLGISYDKMWVDTQKVITKENQQRVKIFRDVNDLPDKGVVMEGIRSFMGGYKTEAEVPLVPPADCGIETKLRFLLEGQRIDPALTFRYWSLSFKPGTTEKESASYSFDSEASAEGLRAFFHFALLPLLASDKDLAGSLTDSDVACTDLRNKSRTALLKAYPLDEAKMPSGHPNPPVDLLPATTH